MVASAGGAPTDIPPRRSSPSIGHRSSFAENLRSSPRSQRPSSSSFGQLQIHDYMAMPHIPRHTDPKFAGRDWRTIQVSELVEKGQIRWAEPDSDLETFTKILIDVEAPNVILIRESPDSSVACEAFDYSDLNAYLLVILGLAKPQPEQVELFQGLVQKSQERASVKLREVVGLARKARLVALAETADVSQAIELFGGGCHRILICKHGTQEVTGVLSQSGVLRFMWDHGANFPVIHQLYSAQLRDLNVGNHAAISINGDRPLEEALQLMAAECLSSIAVVDNALNVVGNISTVDTRLLTRASSIPLLKNTCIHFISVILTERGIQDGKDSFPVFHVSKTNTLAQTVSKIIATRSHRLWMVEPPSPSPSLPATPTSTFTMPHHHFHNNHPSTTTITGISATTNTTTITNTGGTSPSTPTFPSSSVPSSALPGANISGRLTGVVSLTDILNLFARQSGLNPLHPGDQRAQRRRSSSSSMRPSVERPSVERPSLDTGRPTTTTTAQGTTTSTVVPPSLASSSSALSLSSSAEHGNDAQGGKGHRHVLRDVE